MAPVSQALSDLSEKTVKAHLFWNIQAGPKTYRLLHVQQFDRVDLDAGAHGGAHDNAL